MNQRQSKPISFSVTNFIDGENNVRLFRNSKLDGAEFKYLIPAFNFDDNTNLFVMDEDFVPTIPTHEDVMEIMKIDHYIIGAVAVELSAPDILRIAPGEVPHPFICFCRWDLYGDVDFGVTTLLPINDNPLRLQGTSNSLLNAKTQLGIPFQKKGTIKVHLYPSDDARLDKALMGAPAFTVYTKPEFA